MTAYDGQTITYDASGNPLSYYNGTRWAFTWENGRSLATANDGTTNISYAYDANGLRTAKVINGVTHNYLYASGQLMRETYGNNTLDFFYDASGHPYALKYNGTTYYYITNLQGDVMYLIDANENTVAAYEYDPYGNIESATGTMVEITPCGIEVTTTILNWRCTTCNPDTMIRRLVGLSTPTRMLLLVLVYLDTMFLSITTLIQFDLKMCPDTIRWRQLLICYIHGCGEMGRHNTTTKNLEWQKFLKSLPKWMIILMLP